MFVLPFFWNSFNLATEEKWKGWVRETVLWRVSPRGLMQSPQLGNFKMLAEQRRSLEERENTFIFSVKTVSSVTVSLFVFSDRIWQIVNQNNQKQNNQKQEPKELWLWDELACLLKKRRPWTWKKGIWAEVPIADLSHAHWIQVLGKIKCVLPIIIN